MKVVHLAISLCLASFLVACGPSEQEMAAMAERKRIECLDKICPGDVEPKHDLETEVVFKRNGHWFISPKQFGSPNFGPMGFTWPSRTPLAAPGQPPERKKQGDGYDYSIEIFLRSHPDATQSESWYLMLKQAEREGRLISKESPRQGLEVWRINEKERLPSVVWYVATELKGVDGQPPVLACRDQDPKLGRCTTGYMWQPHIAMDMRFRTKHAPDWPEIYQETVRVLSLLREG